MFALRQKLNRYLRVDSFSFVEGGSESLYIYQVIFISGIIMKAQQIQIIHSPTLKTVMAIEDVIKDSDVAISRNKILSKLPTAVMRSTLNTALDYLEKKGIVLETKKGFIWTFNPSRKLAHAEENGLEV